MNSISIDLDLIKLFKLSEEDTLRELEKLKEFNVESLTLPYEVFLNKSLSEFKERLLGCISKIGFKIHLMASEIRNYSTTYVDDKNLQEAIIYHKQFIFQVYELLEEYGLNEGMKVIFSGGKCGFETEAFYLDKAITFFREVSAPLEKKNVDILLELSEKSSKYGKYVGDEWKDFYVICSNIENKNFGVSWNMKNSRINSGEYGDLLIPPQEVLDRVKIATLSNVLAYDNSNKSYNVEMQYEELKSIIKAGNDCDIHLEYIYSIILEKGIPYDNVYESIEYLTYILTYFKNENKKNALVVNLDVERMKRKYIRRYFDNEVLVVFTTNNYRFNKVEMSEQFIRLTCPYDFNLQTETQHEIILRVQKYVFELTTTLIIIRENGEIRDYVFRIENVDKTTRRNILKLMYLTEDAEKNA